MRRFFLGFGRRSPAELASSGTRRRLFTWARLRALAAILALAAISYALGAAAMYFDLPTADFLGKAFNGAEVWVGGSAVSPAPAADASLGVVGVNLAQEAFDGFTLVTTTYRTEATLLDMKGRVVHRWHMPFNRPWPNSARFRGAGSDEWLHWERCHVFANGDLLALCSKGRGDPYGYGVVKLDKDSRLLWSFAAKVHHDLDVDEDGLVYVLTQKSAAELPPGADASTFPCLPEYLVVLSATGERLHTIPLLDALYASPYWLTLALENSAADPKSLLTKPGTLPPGMPWPKRGPGPFPGQNPLQVERGDVLHANSVKVLSRALAPKFPLFKAGQVLLSLRVPNTLAVVDIPRRCVTWAAKGVWQSQHDARFLDNGHVLLFDNLGSSRGSRVLEYDPVTQAVPWVFAGDKDKPFTSVFRGTNQRLPNGNTLIVDSEGARIVEVSDDKKIVWQWNWSSKDSPPAHAVPVHVTGAQRFGRQELPFLQQSSPAPGT